MPRLAGLSNTDEAKGARSRRHDPRTGRSFALGILLPELSSLCLPPTRASCLDKIQEAMLQTLQLAHLPPELTLYVTLYRDVKNAAFLRQQLLDGNADFEYAFIDASMVVSTTHILAAAFRAVNEYLNERLKSRNVHSEIVFALSPNNNIGEAFRRFGVQDTTTDLLVLKVATSPTVTEQGVSDHLTNSIEGSQAAFADNNIMAVSDLSRIRKVYKIAASRSASKAPNALVNGHAGSGPDLEDRQTVETAVLGAIALRGAT